ncbi:MAG: DUF3160 domain-containing protein, partial [Candidatus Marinimicrobia bacterium]|nr:DUF3160 domain-containing protein [Candidatus Neomarinimicrobiota bacterium]
EDLTNLELANIEDGVLTISAIFGYDEDFTQYKVRGHYTRNEILSNYFKAMMYAGRISFLLQSPTGELAMGVEHTRMALLLISSFNETVTSETVWDLFDKVYEPTVFYVGASDDLTAGEYYQIWLEQGAPEGDELTEEVVIVDFIEKAKTYRKPKINSMFIYDVFEYENVTQGFRLMGQRFIPDSYMFAHLIDPYVAFRLMPKGLDIMAILGSDRAYTLLDSLYQETSYQNYPEKIAEFQTEFSNKPPEVWAQNLYWNWLYSLMPLLYEKGAGYPFFMQNLAWMDKDLLTALASWAELRHDTILYAKQSMTPCGITPGPPKSYVEPNPHLYARLASLVRYTREGLDSRNLLLEGFQDKLDLFERLLLFLRDVSIKELENIPLTDSEYENIFCFGKVMQDLVAEIDDPQSPWEMDTDDMAVVADVHTDSNTDQCLEEGVGYPLEVLVIVNEGGTVRITRGAIFSYYEFIQPIIDRLTDEAWREMLTGDTPPSMPQWVSSFMDTSESHPGYEEFSPDNLFHHEFSGNITEEIKPIPNKMMLSQNYPNPFNPET